MRTPTLAIGYPVEVIDSNGNKAVFNFAQSSSAEMVLRGLVHSGFVPSISECVVALPASFVALYDFHKAEEEKHYRNNRKHKQADYDTTGADPIPEPRVSHACENVNVSPAIY